MEGRGERGAHPEEAKGETTMNAIQQQVDRLQKLANDLAVGDTDDALAVRISKQTGCWYEVYAMGYAYSQDCRTAAEAEQVIRQHYAALAKQ